MKKLIVALLVAAVAVAGSLSIAAADNGPAEITLPAKMGNITFPHAAHQAKTDCKTCHHNGVEAGACRSCHNGDKAPKFKTVAHKLCKDCHKKNGVSTSCKTCHKK